MTQIEKELIKLIRSAEDPAKAISDAINVIYGYLRSQNMNKRCKQ